MELTIALCVSPNSESDKIIETLESLPWDNEGIDLVIYSENTGEIKKIIKESDLESTLLNGEMEVLFCESPFSSVDTYMNIGLEDAKTDYITFLEPGDTVDFFDSDLLNEEFSIGLPGIEGDYPVAYTCYDSRVLPDSVKGIIFRVNYLKTTCPEFGESFIPELFSEIISDLKESEYSDGWGKYDISDQFSVTLEETNLSDEIRIPDAYIELWKEHTIGYDSYMRDILWSRIMIAASRVINAYQGRVPERYYSYINPTGKMGILC